MLRPSANDKPDIIYHEGDLQKYLKLRIQIPKRHDDLDALNVTDAAGGENDNVVIS